MGWTSTGDPYANVGDAGFGFDSEEAAVAFAQKHGWEYTVGSFYTLALYITVVTFFGVASFLHLRV